MSTEQSKLSNRCGKICPYCDEFVTKTELPEDFTEFKLVGSWNHYTWACCNLCDAPIEEYEQVEDPNEGEYY